MLTEEVSCEAPPQSVGIAFAFCIGHSLTSKPLHSVILPQVARLAAEIEASNRILEMAQRT
jgi:hypothetical protein